MMNRTSSAHFALQLRLRMLLAVLITVGLSVTEIVVSFVPC